MSCYGHNIIGRSWADDDDDEWEPQRFAATKANIEYDASISIDASVSDNDCNDSGYASSMNSATTSCQDEDDLLTRPSTREPANDDTYSTGNNKIEDHKDGEYHTDNVVSAEDRRALWAPFLQIPYPHDIPSGFRPGTPGWLEHGKSSTDFAFPEIQWQFGHYCRGWHTLQYSRALKVGETLFSSPLRNEVAFDDEEDELVTTEDLINLATELALAEEAETDLLPLDSEMEDLEEQIFEEDSEVVTISPSNIHPDSEMKVVTPSHAQNHILATLKFTCEDELASELMEVEDTTVREKHDSVHDCSDDFVPGLFDEDEEPLSPVSSVLVSTDEEVDMLKKSPLVLPISNQSEISSCTTEQEFSWTTATCFIPDENEDETPLVVLPVTKPSADETLLVTTQDYEKCMIKIDERESTTKDGVRAMTVGRPIQNIIVPYVDFPSSTLVHSQAAMKKTDLCRRLKARYFDVRLASTNAPYCLESSILQTLAGSIVF